MPQDRALELEALLDRLTYLITSARSTGKSEPGNLRDVIKQMRQIVSDAESLVVTMQVEKERDRNV